MALLLRVIGTKRVPAISFSVPLLDSGMLYRGILTDWMDWNVFFLGGYRRAMINLYRVLLQRLYPNKNAIFVDVGASIGQMACSVSPLCGKVIAFEPSPVVAARLREHVEINACLNVTIVERALADANGEAVFFAGGAGNQGTGSLRNDFNADPGSQIKVTTQQGDAALRELRVGQINILKIDAQGAEIRVLKGFSETVKRDRPIVIMSLPKIMHDNEADLAYLQSVLGQNYDVFVVDNVFSRTPKLLWFDILSRELFDGSAFYVSMPKNLNRGAM
jgi:FkbM family methyltransferase